MTYLEDGKANDTQSEEQEKRSQDYNNNLGCLWNTIKCKNIHVIRISEGKHDVEELFEETMMKNFPNLVKEMGKKPQEAQRIPKIRDPNPKRPTSRHIIIKMPKFKYKERALKAAREKQMVTYKGTPIRLAADFSKETM